MQNPITDVGVKQRNVYPDISRILVPVDSVNNTNSNEIKGAKGKDGDETEIPTPVLAHVAGWMHPSQKERKGHRTISSFHKKRQPKTVRLNTNPTQT